MSLSLSLSLAVHVLATPHSQCMSFLPLATRSACPCHSSVGLAVHVLVTLSLSLAVHVLATPCPCHSPCHSISLPLCPCHFPCHSRSPVAGGDSSQEHATRLKRRRAFRGSPAGRTPLGPIPDSSVQLRLAHSLAPRNQIVRRRGLINGPASIGLKEQLEIIARMICGLINGLDKRAG
jgi:hypothetical protein